MTFLKRAARLATSSEARVSFASILRPKNRRSVPASLQLLEPSERWFAAKMSGTGSEQ